MADLIYDADKIKKTVDERTIDENAKPILGITIKEGIETAGIGSKSSSRNAVLESWGSAAIAAPWGRVESTPLKVVRKKVCAGQMRI